jgi:hypothetical protein
MRGSSGFGLALVRTFEQSAMCAAMCGTGALRVPHFAARTAYFAAIAGSGIVGVLVKVTVMLRGRSAKSSKAQGKLNLHMTGAYGSPEAPLDFLDAT